jgi:hypothetical protein
MSTALAPQETAIFFEIKLAITKDGTDFLAVFFRIWNKYASAGAKERVFEVCAIFDEFRA